MRHRTRRLALLLGAATIAASMSFADFVSGYTTVRDLTTAGSAFCWGDNRQGTVGADSYADSVLTPAAVSQSVSYLALWSGPLAESMCALGDDGRGYCWGEINDMHMPQKVARLP